MGMKCFESWKKWEPVMIFSTRALFFSFGWPGLQGSHVYYTPRKRSFGDIKWSLCLSVGSFVRSFLRSSVRPSLRPSQSLIRYCSMTAEQNFMKLSGIVHYMMPYCTSYFKFYPHDFGVSQSKTRTLPYKTWGSGGIIFWALLTVFLV